MKPPGIRIGADLGGNLSMRVVSATHAEDKIWDAVEEAISEGMTPEQFRDEAANAWLDALKRDANHAAKVLGGRR